MPLTATEQALSRINVSNRQGGRGPGRARLQQELGCPAPPRPCSHPPTERVGELPSSHAPAGYFPDGYRSPASELTSSSLSLGGLTNDVDADLDDIDLSGATEFTGPSDTWMASLPDLATVATVGLDIPLSSLHRPRQLYPSTGDIHLSCLRIHWRVMQPFGRQPRRLSRQQGPSRPRRRRWRRRRRMRPRPPAHFLHRYCRCRPYRLWSWRAEWNNHSTPTH